jgi:hypothetical protein
MSYIALSAGSLYLEDLDFPYIPPDASYKQGVLAQSGETLSTQRPTAR